MRNLPVTCTPSSWMEHSFTQSGKPVVIPRKMLKIAFKQAESGVAALGTDFLIDVRSDMERFGMNGFQTIQWLGIFQKVGVAAGVDISSVRQTAGGSAAYVNNIPEIRYFEAIAESGQLRYLREGHETVVTLYCNGQLRLKLHEAETSPVTPTFTELTFLVFDFHVDNVISSGK